MDYPDNIKALLDGWTEGNIADSLKKRLELREISKDLKQAIEIVEYDIKAYLKGHKWVKYIDEASQISVDITVTKTEELDKGKVKFLLSQGQFNSALKTTTKEVLIVCSPADREKLSRTINRGGKRI